MRLHGSEASQRATHEEQERCFLLKTEARPVYNEDVYWKDGIGEDYIDLALATITVTRR